MTVTQTLGEIGDWSLAFRPDSPGHILDIPDYSLIVITSERIDPYVASRIDRPMFRGVILSRDDRWSISGVDLAWYLGSAGSDINQSSGWGPWIGALWTSKGPVAVMTDITAKNGLSFSIGSGITRQVTGGVNGTPRTALDLMICPQLQCDWRIWSDATVELFTRAAMVTAGPLVTFVADDPGGFDPNVESWRLTDARPNVAVTDRRNRVVMRWDNSGTPATSSTPVHPGSNAYGGATLEMAEFTSASSSVAADIVAERDALHSSLLRRTQALTVTTDTPLAVTRLDHLDQFVGSMAAVYDPEIGMYDTSVEPVVFRGQPIWPVGARVTQVEWPVERGMGVFIDHNLGGPLVDVTDWVEWDTGDTTVEMGMLPRWWDGKRRPV